MRCHGGETVRNGFYYSPRSHDHFNLVGDETRVLPGDSGTVYYRLPRAALLLVAPVLGFLFVVFLPVIGIVMTVEVLAEAAGRRISVILGQLAPVASPPEMLGQAALLKKDDEPAPEATEVEEADAEEKALADEVAARRAKGEH